MEVVKKVIEYRLTREESLDEEITKELVSGWEYDGHVMQFERHLNKGFAEITYRPISRT